MAKRLKLLLRIAGLNAMKNLSLIHIFREDILSGKYKQNEELREVAIATELGVSRTPVREAIRQLELEGLVNLIPNKGAYVTGITIKDVKDIYVIRSYLEGLCAKWATEFITEQQLCELEENIYLSEFHAEKEHYDQVLELDNRFHQLLYDCLLYTSLKRGTKAYGQRIHIGVSRHQ